MLYIELEFDSNVCSIFLRVLRGQQLEHDCSDITREAVIYAETFWAYSPPTLPGG